MMNQLNITEFIRVVKLAKLKQLHTNPEEKRESISVNILPLKEGMDKNGNTHVIRHVYFTKNPDNTITRKISFLGRLRLPNTEDFGKRFDGFLFIEDVVEAFNACFKNTQNFSCIFFKSKSKKSNELGGFYLSVPTKQDGMWKSIGAFKNIDGIFTEHSKQNRSHSYQEIPDSKVNA